MSTASLNFGVQLLKLHMRTATLHAGERRHELTIGRRRQAMHFPGDLLASSSAEGGHERQQPPAGGHLHGTTSKQRVRGTLPFSADGDGENLPGI
ncbi:hypothetical protein BDA96_05G161800 [Sorghum bicolor]|uniref:Uncharacterized protein n=2 Tax=Sorghum bicolor TaxID=4558 RepID=A0A921QZL5_SORBI|nr:hypothetical protein BDA96_05G161800 [Sorghum bicolor]KXG28651.1 hypothetical protein SORBI_3005G148300 [Sorghum bicolor]